MKAFGEHWDDAAVLAALADYVHTCPLMAGYACTVAAKPTANSRTSYISRGATGQYHFFVTSARAYKPPEMQRLMDEGLYEGFSDWLRQQGGALHLPRLPDGYHARSISAVGQRYLFKVPARAGRHQILCKLNYTKQGAR